MTYLLNLSSTPGHSIFPPIHSTHLSIHPSFHPSTLSSINSSIHLFTHSFIHSSIHLFNHPSIHPTIHPFIHSSIHPSIHSLQLSLPCINSPPPSSSLPFYPPPLLNNHSLQSFNEADNKFPNYLQFCSCFMAPLRIRLLVATANPPLSHLCVLMHAMQSFKYSVKIEITV